MATTMMKSVVFYGSDRSSTGKLIVRVKIHCTRRCCHFHCNVHSNKFSKAFFGSHAFHLRWFTITPGRISSSPNRLQPTKHEIVYPLFDVIQVDVNRLIINIVNPVKGRHNFTLMAPSKTIFDAVLNAFQVYMDANEDMRAQGVVELEEDIVDDEVHNKDTDADEHVTLIERPNNATLVETILWASVIPLRYSMHFTLPDVR